MRSYEMLVFGSKLSLTFATGVYTLFAYLGLLYFLPNFPAFVIFCLFYLGIAFLFIDFFPFLIAFKNSEKGLKISLWMSSWFLYLSLPFTFIFIKMEENASHIHEKKEGGDSIDEMKETIVEILQKADVQGYLSEMDKKLLGSVVKFKDRIVREVMVPRIDLFCLPATSSIREAAKELQEEGYSRIPIYKETIDNIVGVLMFKDILELYMDCESGKKDPSLLNGVIEPLIKRPFYTPETKKVSGLLQEFRSRGMHMAIVVDEYGGTEGVVTIEDLLEEIVGEITDEYDVNDEVLYTPLPGGGSWIVDARMSIIDAEEILGISIPQEGDYDTIGGYLFHRFGTIPSNGQKVHHDEFDMEILSSTERSVEKVRIISRTKERRA